MKASRTIALEVDDKPPTVSFACPQSIAPVGFGSAAKLSPGEALEDYVPSIAKEAKVSRGLHNFIWTSNVCYRGRP